MSGLTGDLPFYVLCSGLGYFVKNVAYIQTETLASLNVAMTTDINFAMEFPTIAKAKLFCDLHMINPKILKFEKKHIA